MERKETEQSVWRYRVGRGTARLVEVGLPEYEDLLVSRRRLERVPNRMLWLRDLDTDEVFVSAGASSLRLSEGS